MFDVMADWLTVPLLNTEAGKPPARAGLSHPSIAPYGVFSAAGGEQILISIQSEREWLVFCKDVLCNTAISSDPRFVSNIERVRHRAATDGAVAASLSALPIDELVGRLSRADIAFAQLNDMAALSRHPHLRRIEVGTSAGPVSFPGPGAVFNSMPRQFGPVPALGEHTTAILAELVPRHGPT